MSVLIWPSESFLAWLSAQSPNSFPCLHFPGDHRGVSLNHKSDSQSLFAVSSDFPGFLAYFTSAA